MDPKLGDRRVEDVTTAAPGEIDMSLPPPPPPGSPPPHQPPSIPESLQRPHNRALIPAAVLVVVLPIAAWHHRGQRDYVSDPEYSLKAPNWLSELPHPVGLLAVIAVLAVVGWLVVEYWLRGWRHWWFVVLGAFCLMGIYTAEVGRDATAGRGRPDPGDPGWPNAFGSEFFIAAPVVYGALLIIAAGAIYKIDPANIAALKAKTRIRSDFLFCGLSLVPGLLALLAVTTWKFFSEPSIHTYLVEVFNSLIFAVVVMAVFSPLILVKTGFLIASMVTAWFVLFRSADLVLRRKAYW